MLLLDCPEREKSTDSLICRRLVIQTTVQGNLILLLGLVKHNQKYFEGGPKERKAEGGYGITPRDEYFVGGLSKRFAVEEKLPLDF
jgi:hypothetical protein